MATTVTKTIKSSGGDYTSLSAAEAGEQRDLVSADEIAVFECYSMQDTTQVTILGWTTDSTRYIKIYTPAAERHDGKWNTAKYYLEVNASGTGVIVINEDYVRIEGLQIRHTDGSPSGTESTLRILSTGGTTDIRVSYSILRGGRFTARLSSGSNHYWWNNLIYGGTVGGLVTTTASGIVLDIYSCTIIGGDTYGLVRSVGTVTAKNCYAYASGSGAAYSGTITKTTCASDDTTGSSGLQNIAYDTSNFTNVTAGSEDLHLPSGSSLVDVGTDTSGDAAPMNFTDDIDGDTRGATWDVGADELISGAAVLKLINETWQLSESTLRLAATTTITNETLQYSEGVIRKGAILKLISEVIQFPETIINKLASIRIISETIQFGEGVLRWLGIIKLINETVQFAESIIQRSGLVRVINEASNWIEGIIKKLTLSQLIDLFKAQILSLKQKYQIKSLKQSFQIKWLG